MKALHDALIDEARTLRLKALEINRLAHEKEEEAAKLRQKITGADKIPNGPPVWVVRERRMKS